MSEMKKWVSCHIRWQNWWTCESWTYKTRKLCHGKDTFSWEWPFVLNDNCNHIFSYELSLWSKLDLEYLKWVIFPWLSNWLHLSRMQQRCAVSLRSGRKGRCVSLLWLSARPERKQKLEPWAKPFNHFTIQSTETKPVPSLHTCYTNCLSDCEFM